MLSVKIVVLYWLLSRTCVFDKGSLDRFNHEFVSGQHSVHSVHAAHWQHNGKVTFLNLNAVKHAVTVVLSRKSTIMFTLLLKQNRQRLNRSESFSGT